MFLSCDGGKLPAVRSACTVHSLTIVLFLSSVDVPIALEKSARRGGGNAPKKGRGSTHSPLPRRRGTYFEHTFAIPTSPNCLCCRSRPCRLMTAGEPLVCLRARSKRRSHSITLLLTLVPIRTPFLMFQNLFCPSQHTQCAPLCSRIPHASNVNTPPQ